MRILKLAAIAGVTVTLISPAFAQSTSDSQNAPKPTADSAAQQVGKPSKSSMWHGRKTQPSERLPSTDQVKREQPGTIPPAPGGRAVPVTKPDSTNPDKAYEPASKSPSGMTNPQ
ncbi:hypothetical protein GOB93_08565 [Acetobacter musti]|uniref:Serine/threonine protein kinase n=1 Tax=Acetobacter musti TaxID=864732 RepID=A0ABX0JQE1_9PROT|nr:hypothetical protein [Acetobacter musti]NHN84696.1 hypothetical protein [Acetobacter musti]